MISAESMTTLAFATSFGIALLTMPLVRRWALARGWSDNPDPRKVHDQPVPRLGGVGLFAAFWAGQLWIVGVAGTNPLLNGLLVGASIVFLTGLCDDLRGISARQKFAGEITACLAAIAASGLWIVDLGDLFGFGRIVLPIWFGIPFTVFAVVGVINAVNLIDGLDGLAGGLSLIALTAFGLLGLLADDGAVVLICLCLTGAILGFLRYNLRPAHLFMGDAGSLTLGFLLGFLAVHLTQQIDPPAGPMVPVLILALPVCDALRVMILRKLRGQNLFLADRTHVHHHLLDRGLTPRSAVAVLMLIAVVAAVTGIAGRDWPAWQLLLVFVSGAIFVTLLVAMPQRAGNDSVAHLSSEAPTGRRLR